MIPPTGGALISVPPQGLHSGVVRSRPLSVLQADAVGSGGLDHDRVFQLQYVVLLLLCN